MQTSRLYHCHEKAVLRFKPKASEFLKGLTSNILEAPRNAFLDIHGKVVACFDQKMLTSDEVLTVIERPFIDRVREHLRTYLSLSETALEEEFWNVYFDPVGDGPVPVSAFGIPQKRGRLLLSKETLEAGVTLEEYTIFRVENAIALQGVDFDREMLLNVEKEDRVSYTKGCYLGQEIIARVHYRSKPPKKLEVRYEDTLRPEQAARLTSRCRDPRTGRIFGFLLYAPESED
jgi:hypothetical protein